MIKKWLGRAAVILLVAGLIGLGGWWGWQEYQTRQVIASLTFDPSLDQAQSFAAGNFTLLWDPAGGGRLSAVRTGAPGSEAWATQRGTSFVTAAVGREEVKEARAMYFVSDVLKTTCEQQNIQSIQAKGETVVVAGQLTCLGRDPLNYTLTFSAVSENALGFRVDLENPGEVNRLYFTYATSPDEHFFGFGEQFSYFDLKGQRVPVFISEQGIGRGAQPITAGANLQASAGGNAFTTYIAAPYYITSQMRGLFLENTEYMVFDLRNAGRVHLQVFSAQLSGQILSGGAPAELIKAYTDYSGRMRPLPDWILNGAVVGMQGGTARVREVLAQLSASGAPLSAFWLQDWVGHRVTSFGRQLWWNWELDAERYPEWERLVADLKAQDIRTMIYISPFLVDVAQKAGVQRNLFKEAAELGYLVKNANGEPYLVQNTDFSAGMVDLTNPAAVNWYKKVIAENLIGIGAAGWMADFGEGLPYDAVLADGRSGAVYHNQYPVDWAAINRAAIQEAGLENEIVFFTRAGFTRSPRYSTLFWEGDQLVSWDADDGLRSAVTGLLSSGISGMAYNHSDIGGYTTITNPVMNYHRSRELLMRWMELSAFTTVYRTHEGNRPDENAQFYSDAETLAQFTRMAKVYAAWGFYRKQLVQEAAETGLPVVRHPFIQYPQDEHFWSMSYQQFMVGSELMVAPVTEERAVQVQVYLPAGRWVNLWTGEVTVSASAGTTLTVAAPLGQPAVFYPEGSAVGEQFAANLRAAGLIGW
ncbi:MAG TPA: alpha-glucosidase [Anaerolineaceae bacterium]|nr:alpha-glucosidase [Anaerolineaceae bacterium]HPN53809.1 alpha-glucosidase [Anaerolineaceae bacterium]